MKRLAVARYNEDVRWIDQVHGWTVTVVQKGEDMPNEGREPSSFFYAIHKFYPTIKDTDIYAFVQGKPFDHCPDVVDTLNTAEVTGYTPLGNNNRVSDGKGYQDHAGLPVADKCREWLGIERDRFEFVAGGQFIITGKDIKKYPRKWYKTLMKDFCVEQNAWVAERMWGSFYG
jgi:hypothetical protein